MREAEKAEGDDVIFIDVTGKLVINLRAREWCKLPYPGHPHGCPNYGKRDTCPPKAPIVIDVFDLSKPHWFIVEEFDLKSHMDRMKWLHPNWTERQLACCLYWQNTVRSNLMSGIRFFMQDHPEVIYTLLPEAMGVQVILTARKAGIPIEIKPKKMIHKIALVGYPK